MAEVTQREIEKLRAEIADLRDRFKLMLSRTGGYVDGQIRTTGDVIVGGDLTVVGSYPGGVSDHGALTGLGDDDHSQYYNAARHTKAVHDALNIDADTLDSHDTGYFATAGHNHDHGGLTGLGDDDHTIYLLASGARAAASLSITGSINQSTAHAARRSLSSVYSVPHNSVTAIPFSRTDFDTGDTNYSATYTTRLTAQRPGIYLVTGGVQWATSTVGRRYIGIRLNGSTPLCGHEESVEQAVGYSFQTTSTLWSMSNGDYIELTLYQSSGGGLNANGGASEYRTHLALIRIA